MPRLHIGNTPNHDYPTTLFCSGFNIQFDNVIIVCKGSADDFKRACEMFGNCDIQYPFRYDILYDGEPLLGQEGVFAFQGCVYGVAALYEGPNIVGIELRLRIAARKEDA